MLLPPHTPLPPLPSPRSQDVLPFTMPPRKLRVKGELFELPPGFEPFNPAAYNKRFGHRLEGEQQQQHGSGGGGSGGAAGQQPAAS